MQSILSALLTFVVVIGLLRTDVVRGQSEKLPCALQWRELSSGDGLPSTTVASDAIASNYVARSNEAAGQYLLGRLDNKVQKAYLPAGSGATELVRFSFEVLTNNYGCALAWVPKHHPDVARFAVRAEGLTTGPYVGRALVWSTLASGSIDQNGSQLRVGTGNGTVYTTSEYNVLVSTSGGLMLDMGDFVMDEDPEGGTVEMMGMDEILNEADTQIVQTVSHTKTTSESYQFSSSISLSFSAKVWLSIKVCFYVCFEVGGEVGVDAGESQTSTFTNKTERSVSVTRELRVPAYTSVQACSTHKKRDNYESGYHAKAQFSMAGKNAAEVIALVKQNSEWADHSFTEFGNAAVTTVTGTFGGSFSMSSTFYVVPLSQGGCSVLKKFLEDEEQKGMRSGKDLTAVEMLDLEREIRKIMTNRVA